MPAIVKKIDFSKPGDRLSGTLCLNPKQRKISPYSPEQFSLPAYRPLAPGLYPQRRDSIAAGLVALALHLGGITVFQGRPHEPAPALPEAIQVSWITDPQPKAKAASALPTEPHQAPAKAKPKTVTRLKTGPKPVLSTQASQSAGAVEQQSQTNAYAAKSSAAPALAGTPESRTSTPVAVSSNQQPLILPNLSADYLNNPAPRYPENSRERGEQGKVWIRALINTDGTVADLKVKKSSGYSNLDQSALKTVEKWRFVPARRGTTAVSAWVVVPITFSLEE